METTEQILYVRPFSRILDINEIIEYRRYDQTRSCKIVYRSLLSKIKFYEKKLKTLGRGEYEAYKPRCYRKSPNDFLKLLVWLFFKNSFTSSIVGSQ